MNHRSFLSFVSFRLCGVGWSEGVRRAPFRFGRKRGNGKPATRARWVGLGGLLLLVVGFSTPLVAEEVRVTAPSTEVPAELEILEWAAGEGGQVIARSLLPASFVVPPGEYALRRSGTDYRFGPVDVAAGGPSLVTMSSLRVTRPPDAAPSVFFLLDPETGNVALRVPADGRSAAVFPGEFNLVRDWAEVEQSITFEAGRDTVLECGALAVVVPGPVDDAGYHVLTEAREEVAAFAFVSQGPQALLPGRYRVLRRGSEKASVAFEVRPGQTTRLPATRMRVRGLHGAERRFVVVDRTTTRPYLHGFSSRGVAEWLVPGEYDIFLADASPVEPLVFPFELPSNRRPFAARGGQDLTFWLPVSGPWWPGGLVNDFPVRLAAAEGSYVAAGTEATLVVDSVEAGPAEVRVLALGDLPEPGDAQPSWDLGTIELEVGAGRHPIAIPDALPDEGPFVVEVAMSARGETTRVTGRSPPYLAAHSRAGAVAAGAVEASTPTSLRLIWSPAAEGQVQGYEIVRLPHVERPLNGEVLLSEPSFTDRGLSAGTTYRYRVRAVDQRGIAGPWSDEMTASTPPASR